MVPVLLLDGSLQYPSISPDTTAKDLIEALIQLDEVKRTVLDVAPTDWALQRVRKEKPGRVWDETALVALSDGEHSLMSPGMPTLTFRALPISVDPHRYWAGILEPTSRIAPLLNKSDSSDAFPLTSRSHVPVLRLVLRHPLHSISLAFLRIPEIDDGFQWTVFFGKDAIVEDVINNVVQELGLFKVLPASRGGGQIEYTLEVLSGNQGVPSISPRQCPGEVIT